jgi:lambda family phage tail tape measure protein
MTDAIGTAAIYVTGNTDDLAVAIQRAKGLMSGMGAQAQAEAAKLTAADRQRIASLNQQIDKLGMTREQQLAYNVTLRTSGTVQTELLNKIRANSAGIVAQGKAVEKAGIQFNQYGLSQKQQVAAMRQVPAQITDIFTSLQGGQNPLTVLIQQGGQLKDVFGGVVPAARALGSQVLKMVNGWTLLGGALAVTGFAYLQGEQRANAFNSALIMSGQATRLNSDELQAMAQSLDNVSGVTTRQAADALTQIVATGKIATGQSLLVAEAAARMQDVTGKAMSETISEYAELARDPANAILKLNESENFLTQAVYARIKAMQDAGDIEGAAAAATEARAQAQIERAAQVEASLGLVSGAWFKIKQNTGEAWDSAVNYFVNLDREAKDASNTLSRMWQSIKMPGIAGMFGMQAALSGGSESAEDAAARQKAAADQKAINSEAQRQLDAIIAGNRTRAEQQDLEIQRIKNLAKATNLDTEATNKLIDASNKAYNASLAKGPKPVNLDNAQSSAALQAIKDNLAEEQNAIQNSTRTLQAEYAAKLVTSQEYYAKTRDLLKQDTAAQEKALTDQIAFLKSRNVAGKDSINVTKEIGQLESKLAKVRADSGTQLAILGIQETAFNKNRALAADAFREALERSNEAAQASVNAAVARIGMGQQEAAQLEKIAQIRADSADKEAQYARDFAKDNDREQYEQRIADLQHFTNERIRIEVDGFAAVKEAQADWLNGLNAGLQNWLDATRDVAGQVAAVTNRSMDTVADAFTEAASTGKFAWKDMLVSILKDVEKFLVKQTILKFVQLAMSLFGGGATTSGTGAGASVNFGNNTSDFATNMGSFIANAKGNAYSGSPSLSEYSGTVVNRPTPFLFAKGAGVMGEAGEEGIFPLSRGSDGKLGVKAIGAAGGGQIVSVPVSITINSDGSANSQVSTGEDAARFREFGENMRSMAQQEIQRAMRPGGSLWRAGVSTG